MIGTDPGQVKTVLLAKPLFLVGQFCKTRL
jgi:hypothetical protein